MNEYINYYDLLGVDKDASNEEIKKAYRENAKKWHPDLNKDPKAEEMSKKINEAKQILLDENKRKDYDIYLNNYKNSIYNNLNKNNVNSTNNEYETKTYTKWEYFILYLKYYKINIFRKIIGTIFVLIESLFCFVLQLINYFFAVIISFLGYYISYTLILISVILLLLIFSNIFFKIADFSIVDYILIIFGSLISLLLSITMPILPNLFTNKIPILISKLNLFLFKKSIGYKN